MKIKCLFLLLCGLLLGQHNGYCQNVLTYSCYADKNEQGLYGLKDEGEWVVQPQFEDIGETDMLGRIFGLIPAKTQGAWGFFDANTQKMEISAVYDSLKLLGLGIYLAYQNGKQGVVNMVLRKETLPCQYDRISDLGVPTFALKGEAWYVFDVLGDPIEQNPVDAFIVNPFSLSDSTDCSIFALQRNGLWAFRNSQKYISDFVFEDVHYFSGEMAAVKKSGKWGFINIDGQTVVPFEYDFAFPFLGALAVARKGKKWFVISGSDHQITRHRSKKSMLDSDLLPRQINGLYGWQNIENAKWAIPCIYEKGYFFDNGVAWAGENGMYALIDAQGAQLTDFVYEKFSRAGVDDFTFVQKNGYWGIVDNKGEETMACQYHNYTPAGNVFLVQKGDKFGFLDKKGKLMGGDCLYDSYDKDFAFRDIRMSGNLLVKVKKDNLYGFVETNTGTEIVPCQYNQINDFYWGQQHSNVLVEVEKSGKWGFISQKTGEVLNPCQYDKIYWQANAEGLIEVAQNGRYGFVDAATGKEVIPCLYDYAGNFKDGMAHVYDGKAFYYINRSGTCVKGCPE